MEFDDVLRFRVNRADKARLARIAAKDRRKPSDMARIILEDYVSAQEKALNLAPITAAEVNALLKDEEPPASRVLTRPTKVRRPVHKN